MEPMLELYINGDLKRIQADPDTPFVFVLCHELGLRGTKQGCSMGQCGACTILVNGKAERACETATASLTGKTITTIEGLEESFIQDAFIAEQAAQCGFCITGIVMAAAALLKTNPTPTRQEIQTALKDNLRRCGTHTRILRAIENAVVYD